MPLRLELKASTTGPGYGTLTVANWNQPAASIELSVQRNQDGRFLDESGEWTTNPVWHDVSVLEENNGSLSGEMGPWLVDPLVTNPQVAYMFELRSTDHKDKGVLRIMGQILSSLAAGSSLHKEVRTSHEKTTPVVKEEVPAPPPQPPVPPAEPTREPQPIKEPELAPAPIAAVDIQKEPIPVQPSPSPPSPSPLEKRSKLPLILALLALLLLGGGGAAWYLGLLPFGAHQGTETTTADSGEAEPCSEQAMAAGDLEFVQGCLKSSPSSEQLLAVITAAKQARHCEIARRLYAYKAQGGDARIAMAYAREYDPDSFEAGGCIESADGETAAYWYEIVVNKEPDNTDAKQRLDVLGKK